VIKIKKPKKLLLQTWLNRQVYKLADEIGLNLKKLKNGFQTNLWDTVYGFFI
jgi:hypothetical protein